MTHDGFGNLTDKTQTPQGPAPPLSVTVNALTNQLNGYEYDANGNMTAPPGVSSAIYDEENRMVTASPISGGTESYAYGPDKCGVWKLRPGGNPGTGRESRDGDLNPICSARLSRLLARFTQLVEASGYYVG